jgi:hypothetical protein
MAFVLRRAGNSGIVATPNYLPLLWATSTAVQQLCACFGMQKSDTSSAAVVALTHALRRNSDSGAST